MKFVAETLSKQLTKKSKPQKRASKLAPAARPRPKKDGAKCQSSNATTLSVGTGVGVTDKEPCAMCHFSYGDKKRSKQKG